MAKTRTLKKRKDFSLDSMPIVKLKRSARATAHNPDKRLRKVDFVTKALVQCLWDGDVNAFKEIVKAHYEAINTAQALRKIGLSKRTFYEAISPQGNPRLDTLTRIIQGLKQVIRA